MAMRHATRDEAISSVLRYVPVGELPVAQERRRGIDQGAVPPISSSTAAQN